MTLETDIDRDGYLDAFGVSIVLDGVTMLGIFDNAYLETLDSANSDPQVIIATSDAPSVAYGDSVVVASESFTGTVKSIQPDAQGMTTLLLKTS